MWDDTSNADEDWEPLRTRRAGTMRLIAIVVVAAMVIALVIPVALRLLRNDGGDGEPEDGVRTAAVVLVHDPGATAPRPTT